MPLLTDEQSLAEYNAYQGGGITRPVPDVDRTGRVVTEFRPDEPGVLEEAESAFRRTNMIVSGLARVPREYDYDEDYEPLSDIKGYENYQSLLAVAVNKEHADEIKSRIDQERIDNDVLERGGASAIAWQFAAGVLDPTIFIPGTAGFKAAKSLATAKRVAAGSALGATAVGIQEAGLQSTQLLRSKEESINSVLAGAILGGMFGGAASGFIKYGDYKATRNAIKTDLAANVIDIRDVMARGNYDEAAIRNELGQSVGAARISADIDSARIAQEGRAAIIAGETITSAKGIEKVVQQINPILRAMNSPFLQTRLIMQRLINNPLTVEKNANFEATETAVENLKNIYRDQYAITQGEVVNIYKDYKKAGGKTLPFVRNNVVDNIKAVFRKPPPETSFLEEVGKAMRREDKHPIPAVQQAAKEYRKLIDSVANEAVRAGVWKSLPDRKTAISYFSRVWDNEAITENPGEFKRIIYDWIVGQVEKQASAIEFKYQRQLDNLQSNIDDVEINGFRKASFLQNQAELAGKESYLTVADAKASLELLAQGKPKKPRTLLEEISTWGINPSEVLLKNIALDDLKTWNKNNFKKVSVAKESGIYLDELASRLQDRGWYTETPTLDELIADINDALKGRDIVHPSDIESLQDYYYFLDAESVIAQLGIKPKDYKQGKILLADKGMRDFREKLIEASKARAKFEIKDLKSRMEKVKLRRDEELADIRSMGIDGYASMVADDIVTTIRGLNKVNPEYDLPMALRGPLKAQKLLIPDALVERFIINDASVIAERYARLVGTDAELMNKFGTTKLEDITAPLVREYNEQSVGKVGKEATKLKDRLDKDKDEITTVYQLLRGTYADGLYSTDGFFRQLGRATMSYNYMRMLGGVALSSIPDIGKQVAYDGAYNFMKNGLIPLAKAMPKILKGIRPEELKELRFAGKTIQHITNSRIMTLGDLGHRYGSPNNLDRYLNAATKVFSRATGIIEWNNLMEAFGGLMSQRRIATNILELNAGGKISAKEQQFMAAIGIGKREAQEVGEMFAKHHTKGDDGFVFANTEKWENINAVKTFRSALAKDVGSILIEKQIGDVPLFANTVTGQIVLQFKSFMFATLNKTTLPLLQRRDWAALQGVVTMIGLGSLTYLLKSAVSGKEPDYDPRNLLVQGFDNSGILTIFGEVNNIAEKVGIPGLHQWAGAAPASRYASRSVGEAIVGPTLGTITNVGMAIRGIADSGELTDSDRTQIRKLIPYNNLFYLRWLLQQADDETQKNLGYN